MRINRARPNQIREAVRLQLRELSHFRFNLVDSIGDLKRKVLAVLDRVFPEYETLLSSVFLKSSRRLLEKASSAHELADFHLSELTQILHEASRDRFNERKAQEVIDQAKSSNTARQHDPDLKAYYHKKKHEGKHHNTVIGALCRKLLARIYLILQEEWPYVVR